MATKPRIVKRGLRGIPPEMRRELVDDMANDALFLDPPETFDKAIIGIAERACGVRVAAYDRDKCIEALMKGDGMSFEEADEFFEFNTLGAWVGEMTPIFVTMLK